MTQTFTTVAELPALFEKLTEEGVFIDSAHQKNMLSSSQWRVQLRAKSKYDAKAFSYFPGEGSTFIEAVRQAAVNSGAINGSKAHAAEDKPKRRRSTKDLLA